MRQIAKQPVSPVENHAPGRARHRPESRSDGLNETESCCDDTENGVGIVGRAVPAANLYENDDEPGVGQQPSYDHETAMVLEILRWFFFYGLVCLLTENQMSLPQDCVPTHVFLKYRATSIPVPAQPIQAASMKAPWSL